MNLSNILYEPYVIIIFISLIITIITYFIIKNDKTDENGNENNISRNLLITFVASFVILIIGKYAINYMNNNNFFQKGGKVDISDKLTIVADDLDYDILEN
jgi:uncharacterized membrane protein YdjX (TVP38/TMEM64 family)